MWCARATRVRGDNYFKVPVTHLHLGSAERELLFSAHLQHFQHSMSDVNDLTIPEVVQISWAEVKRVKTTAELFLASRTLHSGWILLWWWLNPLLSSLQCQSEEADSYDKSLLFNKSLPYEPNKLPSISIQIYRRHICCSIQIYIHICCSLCRTWMLKKEDCVWQKYCRSLYVCICTD